MLRRPGAPAQRSLAAIACFAALLIPARSAAGKGALLGPSADAWAMTELGTIRGITVGPIENALHPGRGYGSDAFAQSVDEARRMGARWVSLTPFGRVWDLRPSGISLSFEQRFEVNRRAVKRAIQTAHAAGLKVLLVPHLWVETGDWRGEIDPGSDAAWQSWGESYRAFLLTWAAVAEEASADMFSVGVELRSWVTTTRAPSFVRIVRDVRKRYRGLLTYASNWDDVEQNVILGELDVIGVNAFYPLATAPGASLSQQIAGGREIAVRLQKLAELWQKPIVFTEFGYTTRTDPAVRPWEWPDRLKDVRVDELAQADAYRALLSGLLDEPWFAGFFVWRMYADPSDLSQEAEWGFSPRGKLAEAVLRDAFYARWANDPAPPRLPLAYRPPRIGVY